MHLFDQAILRQFRAAEHVEVDHRDRDVVRKARKERHVQREIDAAGPQELGQDRHGPGRAHGQGGQDGAPVAQQEHIHHHDDEHQHAHDERGRGRHAAAVGQLAVIERLHAGIAAGQHPDVQTVYNVQNGIEQEI